MHSVAAFVCRLEVEESQDTTLEQESTKGDDDATRPTSNIIAVNERKAKFSSTQADMICLSHRAAC